MCGFTVRSFDCVHNVPCVGYLIEHQEDNLKLLYASDTEFIRYTFSGLTAMLMEANYGEEYVNREEPKYRHVLQGHQSIETALQCIRANMNPRLAHICLCHLSTGNSDEKAFKAMVQELVPSWVDVTVAEPGLVVDLKETPF